MILNVLIQRNSKGGVWWWIYNLERDHFFFFFLFRERRRRTGLWIFHGNFLLDPKNRLRKRRAAKQVARWKNKKASLVLSPRMPGQLFVEASSRSYTQLVSDFVPWTFNSFLFHGTPFGNSFISFLLPLGWLYRITIFFFLSLFF